VLNFNSQPGTITVYNSGGGVIASLTLISAGAYTLPSGGAYFIIT
jgi:hypothetical protein